MPLKQGSGSEGFASAASPFHTRGCCSGGCGDNLGLALGDPWGAWGHLWEPLVIFGGPWGSFGGQLWVLGSPLGALGRSLGGPLGGAWGPLDALGPSWV